jgi:hypothetical protein
MGEVSVTASTTDGQASASAGYSVARGYITGMGPRQTRTIDAGTPARSRFVVAELNWNLAQPTEAHNRLGILEPSSLVNLDDCLALGHPYDKVKLRIFTGNRAPDWAKALGPGPLSWVDDNQPEGYTVPAWWDAGHLAAYDRFIAALAGILDDPRVVEVTIAGASTAYTEPLLRQVGFAPNRPVALAAGYTEADDVASIKACIDIHHRHMSPLGIVSSLAVNPFQTFTSTGVATRIQTTFDLLEYQYDVMGRYAVWANYSLGAKWGTDGKAVQVRTDFLYPQMYDYLSQHSARVPVQYQTMTMIKMFGLYDPARPDPTVQWAVDHGAISVEMPWGYGGLPNWTDPSLMTEARAAELNAALEANLGRVRGGM